ncbi:MAG: DUF1592 domain-containing protein [Verrucomicrobiota bacterium]
MNKVAATFMLFALPILANSASKDVLAKMDNFLDRHCFDCHDGSVKEGGLDLTSLEFKPWNSDNFKRWQKVFQRAHDGEMPPKEKDRPESEELESFLKTLKAPLVWTDEAKIKKQGRSRGRRLTRIEYENTMHDLLGIDIPLVEFLPADDAGHSFETVAENQQLSHFHLDKYLAAADAALEEAILRVTKGDRNYQRWFSPKELTGRGGGGNYRGPEARGDEAICWPLSTQFYGRMPSTRVPESGWYRITIKGLRGINPGSDGAVWGTIRTGYGYASDPVLFYVASLEGVEKPRDHVYEAWIREDHLVEIKPHEGDQKFAPSGARGGNVSFRGRDLESDGYSGLAFKGIHLERIHPNAPREQVQKNLVPGIKFNDGKPVIDKPVAEINRLVHSFASRAFRRPVKSDHVFSYQQLAQKKFKQTRNFQAAVKEGYRAILCSPRFLTFIEKPGKLDDYAIASRLSYAFWGSMPDWQLRNLAAEGEISKPATLKAQMDRLLADPRSERFISNFTDQWLNLKEIDFTQPDRRRFREFDPVVQDSMVQETRGFIRELIDEDLSVVNFVRSDFSMLNTRLQFIYNLDQAKLVPGKGLQRVSLKGTNRGGLVTHGSVLKVTADGSVTSPILRGVWVNERILGLTTPPPPPNVPAVEPDIRGAVSIRDQLDKHRNTRSCAACHEKIDPPGFALENYDPIGQWRGAYGTSNKSAKVDPSGITPDGQTFAGIGEWKNIYAGKPDMLARAFAKQFLTYSTGAKTHFSDKETIDAIVAAAKSENYGVRTIIQQSILSEIFRTK